MGWTYFHKPSNVGVKDWFGTVWSERVEVLDVAIVKMRTLYAACRYKDTGRVFAAIFLLGYAPKDYYNFGYKDMDETVGPYESECPERILKLLTPTDSEYANMWRERCWANIKAKKNRPKYENGMIVKFKHELTFTNGYKGDIFKLLIEGRKQVFAALQGGRYTITKWKDREHEIITWEEANRIYEERKVVTA